MPAGLSHELAKTPLQDYFIEPGDRILIEPIQLDSDIQSIGDQLVQVDGSVDLGKFGRLRVSGLTVEGIESAIEARIAEVNGDDGEPMNVQLIETNGAEVYVLGAVGSPGSYALAGNETVLDAIVMAGGVTSNASPCDIILVRPTPPNGCRVVLRVCYRQITQLGDVTTNYQIQPGDRVVVGARTLCEELAFWKQTNACECCDRSRCVERHPASVGYMNRFSTWLPSFPFSIAGGDDDQEPEAAEELGQPGEINSDIFLPPAEVEPSGETRTRPTVKEQLEALQTTDRSLTEAQAPIFRFND
jgi:protein involved in polysaccharide export with SLBB domain